jgi:hypothetical protein
MNRFHVLTSRYLSSKEEVGVGYDVDSGMMATTHRA